MLSIVVIEKVTLDDGSNLSVSGAGFEGEKGHPHLWVG